MQPCASVFAQVVHIQIAGVPDRHEPDAGELDYQQVFAFLQNLITYLAQLRFRGLLTKQPVQASKLQTDILSIALLSGINIS